MSAGRRSFRQYLGAIDRRYATIRGVPAPCTPRDVALVKEWFDQGVPLALVLRVLDEVASSHQKGSTRRQPIRSLVFAKSGVRRRFEEQRKLAPEPTAPASEFSAALLRESLLSLKKQVERSLLARAAGKDGELALAFALHLGEIAGSFADPVSMEAVERAERDLVSQDHALADALGRAFPELHAAAMEEATRELLPHLRGVDASERTSAIKRRADALMRRKAELPETQLFFLGSGAS